MALTHQSYPTDPALSETHDHSEYESLSLHAVQAAQVLAAASLRPLSLDATISPDHKRKRNSKSNSDGDRSRSTSKSVKDKSPQEYSEAAKKKWESSRRAGQACDRCKARKIKCDGLSGGCSQCVKANHGCYTTDRLSGKVTSRGYIEKLEHENHALQQRVQELEARLMHHGLPTEPVNGYAPSPGHEQPNNAPPNEWGSNAGQPAQTEGPQQQQQDWSAPPAAATWSGGVHEDGSWQ